MVAGVVCFRMTDKADTDTMDQEPTSGLADADLQAIRTLYHAFNVGDPDLLDEALAENWEDTPMAPGQQPGRAGMKPMLVAFRAAFAELSFTPEDIAGFDGRAAVRLTLRGRHTGEWMGVKATGRAFAIAMHEFHHLEGGRIAHTWHLEDWAGWRDQVASPAEPSRPR